MMKIDAIDNQILHILSENSRIKLKELADLIHLSAPATKQRILNLQDSGVIARYTIDINHFKLGYTLHVFLHFALKTPDRTSFIKIMEKWQGHFIQQCQSMGDTCFIVEGRFRSQDELWHFLEDITPVASYKVFNILKGSNQNVDFTAWYQENSRNA
ncbi:Lrp/AsnC family transcriptional regulator [uncultured Limosilactobacillus sp.]|uniref:Lrp/AsnC family transcriptional regulator n=1 Tax=uncultured Limosilactobacillus sp. TaxID=2837629 RepID=UPI0025F9CA29|nr:Lrp/AsnC family transcriptional regulator [uncultured Limosilactobacillus sp.]